MNTIDNPIMSEGTKIIFLGPPGAGKGTQAQVLADLCAIPHISTGEILRQAIADKTELGQQAQAYVDRGELVPDTLILDLIRERLSQEDAQKGWILDGFPRNVEQAKFLEQLLQELNQNSDYVINLEVDDQVLIERLLARGRKDDNEETITRRLEVYRAQTAPVIDYYQEHGQMHSVNGDRTMEEVTNSLKELVLNI
jgi:adenylate kinase